MPAEAGVCLVRQDQSLEGDLKALALVVGTEAQGGTYWRIGPKGQKAG
jgi:hypothetical protein